MNHAEIKQRAEKMQRMSYAITDAIKQTGDQNNTQVVIGALGSVIGIFVSSCDDPERCMRLIIQMAQELSSMLASKDKQEKPN